MKLETILSNRKYLTLILVSICLISFSIKLSLTDLQEPALSDAATYQSFALNLMNHGTLPNLHNIGFSFVLVLLFKIVTFVTHNNTLLFYANVQRIFTVILSCAIIPISYLFYRKFFNPLYALIGVGILAFEPHIIQNAVLGITEPLYLLFSFTAFWLVTNKNRNIAHLAFVFTALATITRFEGIAVLVVTLIIYFARYYKKNHYITNFLIIASCFILPLVAFSLINLHFGNHTNVFLFEMQKQTFVLMQTLKHNFIHALSNSIIYFGWSMFPAFIFLIPVGIFALVKQKEKNMLIMLLGCIAILGSTGILAYFRAFDTRYYLHTYTIVTLVCLYGLQYLEPYVRKYFSKDKGQKIENTLLIALIISSLVFAGFTYDNYKTNYSFTDENKNVTKADSTALIYPTFTISAYDKTGFYTYYKGLCGVACLHIDDKFNILSHIQKNPQGLKTILNLGYPIITDRELTKNPEIINHYKTIIILHNEYVTQEEFDAITKHPNVIYLYPNALYGKVYLDSDNSILLIRGHGYPNATITNGFNWKLDNGKYEGVPCGKDWQFYKVDNGFMLNCYPENIINKDPNLWLKVKELANKR